MLRRFLIIMTALFLPATGFGQVTDLVRKDTGAASSPSFLKPARAKRFSLLDPEKVSMSHQYSMLFSSGSRGRGATGVYQNTISYKFSPSMLLRVNVGVVHQLMSSSSLQTGQHKNTAGRVIPGFDFTYRPSDKMIFHVSYGMPQYHNLNSRYTTTDPTWFEGTTTTSPLFRSSSDVLFGVSP